MTSKNGGNVTPAQKVAQYVKLRDHKRAAEEEFKKGLERINLALAKLEGELLAHLDETGGTSLKCKEGTVYKTTALNCSVEDRDAFLEYVVNEGKWDALDVKANKTFVKELLEAESPIPPGVKTSQYTSIGVRRAS
jgi:hypothetical protein